MASVPLVASVLFGVLLTYIAVTSYIEYRKYPQFKGPFLASISGLWLLNITWRGRLYLSCAEALEKYGRQYCNSCLRSPGLNGNTGSPVRIAPGKIMTDDPVILRHMSAPRSNFRRGTFYDGMSTDPNINNVISERDEKLHNALRAKLIRGVRQTPSFAWAASSSSCIM